MNGVAESLARRFVYRLAQGRMRVNRRFDLFVRRLERDRKPELGNHLGRFWTDNVRAENFPVRLADDEFDEPLDLANRPGFPARAEGELADAERLPRFLGSALS